MKRLTMPALLLAGLLVAPSSASASTITFSFDCVSNNSQTSCNTLESQMFVDVYDENGMAVFQFRNTGPLTSSIHEVYLMDPDDTLDFDHLIGSTGVSFVAQLCNPDHPPGADGFSVTDCSEASPPPAQNGINPGEWLKIYFTYNPGFDITHVQMQMTNGYMQAGIHSGLNPDSETGVTGPPMSPVPEPGTWALLGTGLLGLVWGARRRRTRKI